MLKANKQIRYLKDRKSPPFGAYFCWTTKLRNFEFNSAIMAEF